jgi:hypothetical protein
MSGLRTLIMEVRTVSDLTLAWAKCVACARWIYRLPGQNEWPAYVDRGGED